MPAHKILFNTGIMYVKAVVTIVVSLFSTRYVLNALGVEDLGIFNVVGGMIGLLSFLNSSLTISTRRFLSYHRGQAEVQSIFSTSLALHAVIGALVLIVLEIIRIFFLDSLNILPERLPMAHLVFHCMETSTFLTILSVPYSALIFAHEDMHFNAITGITVSLGKLGIAGLLFIVPWDRLGTYGVTMACLSVLEILMLVVFCKIRYPKIYFSFHSFNKKTAKAVLSFSGWTFFFMTGWIIFVQGTPVVFNLFFGTAINAVAGIATQVKGQLDFFSNSLVSASIPQINGHLSSKNLKSAQKLAVSVCKMAFFVSSFVAIPLVFNIDFVLLLWLKTVPDYLPIFCILMLTLEMFNNLTSTLQHLIDGTGRVRGFYLGMGCFTLLGLPITYLLFHLGYAPPTYFVSMWIVYLSFAIVRIYFAKRQANLSIRFFASEMYKIALLSDKNNFSNERVENGVKEAF